MQVLKVSCMTALKSWMDLSIMASSLYPNSASNYDNEESCLILERIDLFKFKLYNYSLLQSYLVVSCFKWFAIKLE
jgi:hypothetical protein